jgi:hypothetical protein
MRHNCGRSEDLFRNCEEIRSRQRLSGFDLPICNFLRIGIDDGRAASPASRASRESPNGPFGQERIDENGTRDSASEAGPSRIHLREPAMLWDNGP